MEGVRESKTVGGSSLPWPTCAKCPLLFLLLSKNNSFFFFLKRERRRACLFGCVAARAISSSRCCSKRLKRPCGYLRLRLWPVSIYLPESQHLSPAARLLLSFFLFSRAWGLCYCLFFARDANDTHSRIKYTTNGRTDGRTRVISTEHLQAPPPSTPPISLSLYWLRGEGRDKQNKGIHIFITSVSSSVSPCRDQALI